MAANETSASAAALTVDRLSVSFATERGRVSVLNEVSFTVAPGETVGLVGESGSGKSVTELAIMRLLAPTARIDGGRIELFGRELVCLDEAEMDRVRGDQVAMIFQEPMTSLDPAFTIGQQIDEVIRRHMRLNARAIRERTLEMLALVGIGDPRRRVDAYPHQFSGGMRQRVLIARALACEPRVLLADEPTTALDVTTQAQILELIQELAQRFHMATVFATHDLGVVARVCDRVVVMYAGQVVETGTLGDVFFSPAHPYTARLLACVPSDEDDATFDPIPGHVPAPYALPAGCRFHPRCEFAVGGTCTDRPIALSEPVLSRTARCVRIGEFVLAGVRP
jgi:oligopeptide/dipeptide ABC transporter ATP-binding protein